jgi:hypothetical protein
MGACALQNSNLVLTAETRTREGAEPSGEPDSLWGRMKGKMGDRALKGRSEGLEERKSKARKKCAKTYPCQCDASTSQNRHCQRTSIALCSKSREQVSVRILC